MTLNPKHNKYITFAIVVGFLAPLACLILGVVLYPPSYEGQLPRYAPESMVILSLGLAFYMCGSTVMGIKLADEKKVLAAAGFTIQAIAAGVIMASTFEIINPPNLEAWEKGYYITTSANFMYLPSMLLIAACDEFKKWVRWTGVFSALPYVLQSIVFLSGYRNFSTLELLGLAGYVAMLITQVMWAVNTYKNYHNKKQPNGTNW